ncbi:MAG TPA: PepSY domain-containing protein, partial [Candidatus Saccharibacteria bacterium]|nr:PepSY domain-containing protein [Candidatus Saccharibacteria bacterium]
MKRKESILKRKLTDEKLTICQEFKKKLLTELSSLERDTSMANKQSNPHPQLNLRQLTKQKKFLYASGFAVLLIAAVSIYAIDNRSQNLARQSEIEDVVELPEALDNVLGIEEMRTLAGTDTPAGASITGVELENEHGAVLYKVKFSDGSYRLYDAATGLAYIEQAEDGLETDESVPADFVPTITLQQARDIAQEKRAGKTITKIELETEGGVVVYSVRFSDDGRVDVNATDGSIVRVKEPDAEDSSDESDDSKAEDD